MGGQATLENSSSPRLTPPTQRVARRPNSHRPGPPGRSPPQDRHSVLYDSRPRWLKSSLSYLELIYPRQPTRAGCAPGSCCIFPPGTGGLIHGVRESTPTSNRPRASRKAFHQNGFPGQHSTTVICARSAEDNGSREVTLDENYDRRYVVHGVLLGGHYSRSCQIERRHNWLALKPVKWLARPYAGRQRHWFSHLATPSLKRDFA